MTENPGELVEQAVERALLLIETWPAWDGQPLTSDDGRIYTPHKAVRRIADHIVDHLAEHLTESEWYADQVGDLRTAGRS